MNRVYRICSRCVMDTSDPEITFDQNGVCNHCHDYDNQAQYIFSQEKLQEVAAKVKEKGKGKEYDCVIGLSGGVDSCMSAYIAKEAGLNPLAVHVDNGWNTEISQCNIERTVRRLNIDLFTHVIDWEEFKDIQRSFLYASVPNIDFPYDHAIVATLFKKAAELGVRYIIFGTNIRTEFIMPRAWGYNSWDSRHLRGIHREFGRIPIKTCPTISLWEFAYYLVVKNIRIFRVLDYIDYHKVKAKAFLKKEFGWKDYGGKHCESIYTRFFVGQVLPRKFGFERNRAWVSVLILSGQKTREEGLEELARGFYSSKEEMEEERRYVVKKLGFTEEEFERIMALPTKRHTEYSNNSLFLDRSGAFVRTARKVLRRL